MTKKSFGRLQRMIALEPRWVYVGFKHDGQFLGGIVLQATTFHEAANRAAQYGVRGDVTGFIIDKHITPNHKFQNRILSIEECTAFEESIRTMAETHRQPSN